MDRLRLREWLVIGFIVGLLVSVVVIALLTQRATH